MTASDAVRIAEDEAEQREPDTADAMRHVVATAGQINGESD